MRSFRAGALQKNSLDKACFRPVMSVYLKSIPSLHRHNISFVFVIQQPGFLGPLLVGKNVPVFPGIPDPMKIFILLFEISSLQVILKVLLSNEHSS